MKKAYLMFGFCLALISFLTVGSAAHPNRSVDKPINLMVEQTIPPNASVYKLVKDDPLNGKTIELARRGCCSHHGGVCGCDQSTDRIICCDGTFSPSCRCSTY